MTIEAELSRSKAKFILVSGMLNAEHKAQIELFGKAFDELWANWENLRSNGLKVDVSISDVHGTSPSFIGDHEMGVGRFRLKGLYIDFRQFWLQKSDIEFNKICNMIARQISNDLVRDTVKILKGRWKKEPILFDKHGYSSADVINAVFNGELFHLDQDKVESISSGYSVLPEEALSATLFFAIYDRIAVLQRLNAMLLLLREGKDVLYISEQVRFGCAYKAQ